MPHGKTIRNYTTSVSVQNTVSKVSAILARNGAKRILTDYDGEGTPCGMTFELETPMGMRAFELPVRFDGVYNVIRSDKNLSAAQRTPKRAQMIAWRNAEDWLIAQFALVDSALTTPAEILLPFMRLPSGETVYELYASQGEIES